MSVPFERWWIRCSIKARIGAIPVPGPTNIQGTSEPGARIPPFTSPTGISEPGVRIVFRNITFFQTSKPSRTNTISRSPQIRLVFDNGNT